MKTLGLIGGTSWVSTLDYYKQLNRGIQLAKGGSHSPELILYSVNFQEFKDRFDRGDWEGVGRELLHISRKLETAGAHALMLCSNTTHIVAKDLESNLGIPVLHIADATAAEIKGKGLKKVGLLGTLFTMEHGYFQEKLLASEVETLIPNRAEREYLNHNIFEELSKEIFTEEARIKYLQIISELVHEGAEGIIFGCTEIPLLLEGQDLTIPCFDTLKIHIDYGIQFLLSPNARAI
jgi:aspartate racemase